EDECDSDNESVMTFNSNTSSTYTSNTTLSNKMGITRPLDNFAIRKLSTNQERKWWYLVLKATISNGWSFR
ncbi:16699_t:CDS:1, partial [Funneliformis caledonium]